MSFLLLTVLVVLPGAAVGFGFRLEHASTPTVLWSLAIPYAILAGLGLLRMWREGELSAKLRPRSGDLALGALIAMVLYLGAMLGRYVLTPSGSPREQWLMRLYLQLGDAEVFQRQIVPVSLAIATIAILEEIAWRGLGYGIAEKKWGPRRAFPLLIVLYGVAQLPTLFVLAAPGVGYNPLLLFAALGCGIVWTFLVATTGRLPVAMASHALFTWLVTVQFPLWKLG